jgi:hypothetical protein
MTTAQPLHAPSQPHAGPERINVRAIRIDGERIVEGKSDWDAIDRAVDAGLIARDQIWDKNSDGTDRVESGYLTSHGRLVQQDEAMRIAREAGQIRRNSIFNRESGVIKLNSKRYWGAFSVDSLKGLKKRTEFAELPNSIRGEIRGGEGEPVIESRAIQYDFGKGEGVQVQPVERFGRRLDPETRKPLYVIEGYQLSDGSFITRHEARERFANADIGPEGRSF